MSYTNVREWYLKFTAFILISVLSVITLEDFKIHKYA